MCMGIQFCTEKGYEEGACKELIDYDIYLAILFLSLALECKDRIGKF